MKTLNSQVNHGQLFMSVQLNPQLEKHPGIELLRKLLASEVLCPVKSYVHRTGKGTEAHTVSDLEQEIKIRGRKGLADMRRYAYMLDDMKMTGWDVIVTYNDDKLVFSGRVDENFLSVLLPISLKADIDKILNSIESDTPHKLTEAS